MKITCLMNKAANSTGKHRMLSLKPPSVLSSPILGKTFLLLSKGNKIEQSFYFLLFFLSEIHSEFLPHIFIPVLKLAWMGHKIVFCKKSKIP